MRQAWEADLESIKHRMPSRWARWVQPRLVVLPAWCTGRRAGAWTLFNCIIITQQQRDCPEGVRRYVLGHEFGHIARGHTALQWAWLAGALLYVGGISHPAAIATSLVIQTMVMAKMLSTRQEAARELSADDVAVELFGASVALEGARWMCAQRGDGEGAVRRRRLARLEECVERDRRL